jgi:ABC-type Na+ transport system ATPase subunit NatA
VTLRFEAVSTEGLWLDCEFVPGLHVLLGPLEQGPRRVLELASGRLAPRRGRVLLASKQVFSSPETRATQGVSVGDPEWPAALTVQEVCKTRLALHAQKTAVLSADAALRQLGLEALASKRCGQLSVVELRAAQLSLALALESPSALLLEDPLGVPGISRPALLELLAARAQSAVVLVATEERLDCEALGGRVHLFMQGNKLPPVELREPHGPTRYRITCANPGLLAQALLGHPSVSQVHAPAHSQTLEIMGPDAEALSFAISDALLTHELPLENWTRADHDLETLQAAARGHLDGAYAAAYQAAHAAQYLRNQSPWTAAPSGYSHTPASAYSGQLDSAGQQSTTPAKDPHA